jgi:periplasmic protein CpxP/Spy
MKKLALMACLLLVVAMTANAQTQPDTTNRRTQTDTTNRRTQTDTAANRNQGYPNQGMQIQGTQNQDDSTWVSMGRTPQERADLSSMRIKRKLNLNDQQTAKIRAINLKKAMKVDELRAKYKADNNRTQKEPDFQALMDETNTEYKAVLTPAQYTRWQEMESKYKKNKMEKREGTRNDKMDQRKTEKPTSVMP